METHNPLTQIESEERAAQRKRRREELTPNVCLVPTFIVDRWLALLTGNSFKALLYLCKLATWPMEGSGDADLEEIAEACGLTIEECLRALSPLTLAGIVTADVVMPGDRAVYALAGG